MWYLEILAEGYECSASKRKENIIERCLQKEGKKYKAVLVEVEVIHPGGYIEKVMRLIHFGKITYKKERRRMRRKETYGMLRINA